MDEDAEIIYGTSIDPALGDAVTITLIATGFDGGRVYDQPVVRRPAGREREREYAPEPRVRQVSPPPAQPQPRQASQPAFPEDEWVAESSIIKFLRER